MPAERSSREGQPRSRRAGPQAGREEPPDRQARVRDDDTLLLQDPRDIRALAHPARMAIIDALASGDELTATECAELHRAEPQRDGISPQVAWSATTSPARPRPRR